MNKYTNKIKINRRVSFFIVGALILILSPLVRADTLQQQINNLQNQNAVAQGSVDSLQSQAKSFQNAINLLQSQINAMQIAISANQQRISDLQNKIVKAQADLDYQKSVLASDVRAIYVGGSVSTIEQLASSKNMNVFVDQQTYQKAVEGKIQKTLTEIAQLQNQLNTQKAQVQQTLNLQQVQNAQLASDQQKQQSMLGYNQSQQDSYNQQIQSNQSKIVLLRQEQLAANKKLDTTGSLTTSGSCGGTYPSSATGMFGSWGCNYAHSSDFVPGCDYMDNWGMCNRECVSYTAWMVYSNYGISTNGFGNAKDWIFSAQRIGIPVGSTPKIGSVAIYTGGTYGHAMWVVGVEGNQVHVLSYNDNYDGNFYDHYVNSSSLTFIYFGG